MVAQVTAFDGLTVPQRNDKTNFAARGDTWIAAWKNAGIQMNTLTAEVNANAIAAAGSASAAATSAGNAATSATQALASAQAAASAGNAAAWVSGTNYTAGTVVYSPINFKSYRNQVGGISTVDPSSDSVKWTSAVSVQGIGSGSDNLTGNQTFTVGSGSIIISPNNYGYTLTLDDARNFVMGYVGSVYNNSDFDLRVADNTGTLLGFLRARTATVIGCAKNATQAGSWVLPTIEKVGVSAYQVTAGSYANSPGMQRVTIDANRDLFMFASSSAIYAQVYDKSSNGWGAATLIRSGMGGTPRFAAVLSAANQVLVTSVSNAGNDGDLITLTIAGTGITPNTANRQTWAPGASGAVATGALPFSNFIQVGTAFVFGYSRSGVSCVRAVTVSGAVPSIGAEVATTLSGNTLPPNLYAYGTSNVLALASGASTLAYIPMSIAGNVLTIGTGSTTTVAQAAFRSLMLGTGRVLAFYMISGGLTAGIFSFNTSTNTATQSAQTVSADTGLDPLLNLDVVVMAANKVAFCGCGSGAATPTGGYVLDNNGTPNSSSTTTTINGGVNNATIAAIGMNNAGTVASFTGFTTASATITLNVDTSGAISAISFPGGSTVTQAYSVPAGSNHGPSDTLCNRRVNNMLVGGGLYMAQNDMAHAYWTRQTQNGLQLIKPPVVPLISLNTGVVANGASNAESWYGFNVGPAFNLCKLEAAA